MLENLHSGQFGKSAVLWHYLVPNKCLCGYTLLFFYDFNFISNVFINFHEHAIDN